MAIKTFTTGEVLTAADTNTYLANSGLVYITSGALSGSATNFVGCFTSAYTNYRITITNYGIVGLAQWLYLQYLVGTTPQTSNNYFGSQMGFDSAGATSYPYWRATFHYLTNTDAGTASNGSWDIFNPQVANSTGLVGQSTQQQNASFLQYQGGGTYGPTTQCDGLRFTNSAGGAFNGQVTIYGYRKA